ncbi:MAG: 5-deoxy-glucuronate isomerase, partial [Clostridia bacterium]|nr:5-deoxy-glucuronate isomerase [Clostridia bacterium]
MLERPQFNENNVKILCEMGGKNAEMLMNIYVKRLEKGGVYTLSDEKNETAFLLLGGKLAFDWGSGSAETAYRENPFQKTPYALH